MSSRRDDKRRHSGRWKVWTWAFAATLMAGAGGYYAWLFLGVAEQARVQTGRCRDEIGSLDAKMKGLSGTAAACESERNAFQSRALLAEGTLGQMEGNLSATRQELEALRVWKSETAKRLQTFRDMSEKLQSMVDTGKLGVRVRDGRLVMRLPDSVLFPSGKAELSREGELALMEVAVILRAFSDRRFMVAGHTDSAKVSGASSKGAPYKDNWELSMARALVVTRFLVEAKIKPQALVTAGYGEFDPIASNQTEAGQRENRRIEIVLLPDLSELPTLPEDLEQAEAPKSAPKADEADAPR
jgi:chemotaxis protein MotB